MSEWLDNQRKSIDNFLKLLKERIEITNPRRELTTEETNRLVRNYTKSLKMTPKLRLRKTD